MCCCAKPFTPLALPPSTEEYAISAAASIAMFFLRRDRTLGLVAVGQRREVLQADRGERQLEKILETLAVLRARGNVPFEEILYRETPALPRGTTLVLISPSTDPKWAQVARHLKRSGLHVTTVVLDAKSFGGPARHRECHRGVGRVQHPGQRGEQRRTTGRLAEQPDVCKVTSPIRDAAR